MKGSSDNRLLNWVRPQVDFLLCSHISDALLFQQKYFVGLFRCVVYEHRCFVISTRSLVWNCNRINCTVFTLVQNLWIISMILPLAFRYCQSTRWWPHYNHFVTILGKGLYNFGKLVRIQSNKNPFWRQSCWLVWFARYWSLCCSSLVTKLLFD